MSYLSAQTHQQLIANPSGIAGLYARLYPAFASDIPATDPGKTLPNACLAAAFSAVVAFDLKPYGTEIGGGGALPLPQLLASPGLVCSGYVALCWHFINLIPASQNLVVAAVGWRDGFLGANANHAQMFVTDPASGITLLLDPTCGILCRHTYDNLLMGKPQPVLDDLFPRFGGSPVAGPLHAQVRGAIINGAYRPSNAWYYAERLDFLESLPAEPNWPTPAAARDQR